ncbi:hypothetical protein Pan153_38690 [Gimesia panareensis]|uniref:Outer membrane lipoprotein-sorting protein n=1 Tax=Gimesia panareensis TaxID=2527978 RepID=A0A518FS91_9PLAN|nr:outer membrane lipoprotein-sorting protein [Gimesia panareensis]QDV19204.1 hypothetical protein Pan153_38690 [Gimesia panareensis]
MSAMRPALFSGCLILILVASGNVRADEPQTGKSAELQTLIKNLEHNEGLYRNLKLKLELLYEHPPAPVDPDIQARQISDLTLIVQGENYRQEKETRGRFRQGYIVPPNKPYNHFNNGTQVTSQVYDGETLRKLHQYEHSPGLTSDEGRKGGYGSISHEHERMDNLLRPHMMLLNRGPRIPLSTWFKGQPAIIDSPGLPSYNDGTTCQIQLLGEEEFQELKCLKVQIDRSRNGKHFLRYILWLARERNLLPARVVIYQPRRSKTLPQSEALVDEWQELRPGVWFPRKFHQDRLNWIAYIKLHKEQVGWREEYLVKSVELDPALPENTFTRLDFPKGIVVDGKALQE